MDRYRLRGVISLSRGSKDWTLDSFDVNRKYQDAEGACQLKLSSATTALHCQIQIPKWKWFPVQLERHVSLEDTIFTQNTFEKYSFTKVFRQSSIAPKACPPTDPTRRRPFDENNGNAEMAFSFFVRLTHLRCMQASVPLSVCLFATR